MLQQVFLQALDVKGFSFFQDRGPFLKIYPESPDDWLKLIEQYLEMDDKERALVIYDEAADKVSYDDEFFIRLAGVWLSNDYPELAETTLKKGTELRPESSQIWESLALFYRQQNNPPGETEA